MFKLKKALGYIIAGISAGAVNGLVGAGGGMILIPLLTILTDIPDEEIFPTSVSIILPICLISLAFVWHSTAPDWNYSLPYLIGSLLGGIAAGICGKNIPTLWLHRALGVLMIWGGIRYIC